MSEQYHHGDLRRSLVERAIQVVEEKGLEKLSLRGLARDLNVSHAAPLRHFPTKAALLTEIAHEGVMRVLEAAEATENPEPGLDQLRQMITGYVRWTVENAAHYQILRNPDVMRHANDELKQSLHTLAAIQRENIKVAQENGWRTDENPQVLYLHLLSLTAGTAIVLTDPMYSSVIHPALTDVDIQRSLDQFLTAN